MAEGPDRDSKTEQATDKKLEDAREQGNVPVSRELANFAYLLAGLMVFSTFSGGSFSKLAFAMANLLKDAGEMRISNDADAMTLLGAVGWEAIGAAAPVIGAFALAGIGSSVLQNPPIPVFKRIMPELSRISLSKGFKRLVSSSGLLEFAKTIFRFGAIVATALCATWMIWNEFQKSLFADPGDILAFSQRCVLIIFAMLAAASMFLLIADAPLSQILWRRGLKMAPQEIKDEHKQAEGDPRLKSRRRSIAKDRARKRMLTGVPRATVIIANPTHFAVALRYVRAEGGAPKVVAKGQDLIALTIRRIAEEHKIPVIEDKALARSLYAKVEVDQMIPAEFYRAIAEILIRLQARKKAPMLHA